LSQTAIPSARLAALDGLGGHLTSPEALDLLRQESITHVYIGQRGGPINVDELLQSPAFALEYHTGSVYVFRFLGIRPVGSGWAKIPRPF
jgi:hypothetical protein